MCYRWFGRAAENIASDKLKMDLERAHIDIRAGAYVSCAWVNTIFAGIISTVVYVSLILLFSVQFWFILVLAFIPVLTTIVVYFYFMVMPGSRARARARKIDLNLPYALNFIAAM